MIQNQITQKPLAQVGEDIGLTEGLQMVQAYRQQNPADCISHNIGKDILLQILAQPGCEGINIASAAKPNGERTLVLIGLDANSNPITQYSVVSPAGRIEQQDAIVADRIRPGKPTMEEIWEEMLRQMGF